jgi:hypothetical protein
LQCAQMKMLKPRPLQLAHTAPLRDVRICAIYSSENSMKNVPWCVTSAVPTG